LNELVLATQDGDPTIIKTKNGYGLRHSKFQTCESHKEVEIVASETVQLISGICKVLLSSRAQIRVSGITRYLPDGKRQMFDSLEDTLYIGANVSTTLTNSDGTITTEHQADPVLRWLSLAQGNEHIAKVFRLLNGPEISWAALYNIYEVIEKEAGGSRRISAAGWVSNATINRFKHSANSPSVGGDSARHGVESTSPPSDPMDLAEARAMVEMILHGWLRGQTWAPGTASA
jgi:hypothetical protein